MKSPFEYWRNRKRYNFVEMPNWLLVVLGGGAFLVSGYSGLALKDIVPAWIVTINKLGYLDAIGTSIGLLLLLWGVILWFFSCVTARCHGVLYERWFK